MFSHYITITPTAELNTISIINFWGPAPLSCIYTTFISSTADQPPSMTSYSLDSNTCPSGISPYITWYMMGKESFYLYVDMSGIEPSGEPNLFLYNQENAQFKSYVLKIIQRKPSNPTDDERAIARQRDFLQSKQSLLDMEYQNTIKDSAKKDEATKTFQSDSKAISEQLDALGSVDVSVPQYDSIDIIMLVWYDLKTEDYSIVFYTLNGDKFTEGLDAFRFTYTLTPFGSVLPRFTVRNSDQEKVHDPNINNLPVGVYILFVVVILVLLVSILMCLHP